MLEEKSTIISKRKGSDDCASDTQSRAFTSLHFSPSNVQNLSSLFSTRQLSSGGRRVKTAKAKRPQTSTNQVYRNVDNSDVAPEIR